MNTYQTAIQLCDIIRHSIDELPYNEEIKNENQVFQMAKENGVSGLIYHTLKDSSQSKVFITKLKKEYLVYVAQGTLQDEAIDAIMTRLTNARIPHIFMKGSTLRTYYPNKYLRSMGDIDLVVQPGKMKEVHRVLEQNGFVNTINSAGHDSFTYKNGCNIEVHPQLTRKLDNHDITIFDGIWNHDPSQITFTRSLPPELELTYLVYHTAKHILSGGIGLRTILDIGLFIRAHNNLNIGLLISYLKQTNLFKFAKKIFHLQTVYFNIEVDPELVDEDSLEDDLFELTTKYIAISGVHGTGEKFNRTLPRLANQNNKHKRLSFLFSVAFPSPTRLSQSYPIVKKSLLFYPIGWAHKMYDLLVKRRKQSFRQLKQTAIKTQYLDQTSEMMRELGL